MNNILNQIKKNKIVNDFIIENNLDDKYLNDHLITFMKFYESQEKCLDCKGLYMCNQKGIGQKVVLKIDSVLLTEIEYCDYYNEKKKLSDFFNNYIYADIPFNLIKQTFNDIILDDDTSKGLYVELNNILDDIRKKGLYIYGDLGVGKTYMAIALANALVKKNKKVAFIKVGNFINEMRRLISIDGIKFNEIIENIKKAEYLFLDDIGSESVSSFSRDDILFSILDYRMEEKLITIFTSNLSKNDLLKHYTYDKSKDSSLMNAKRLLERIDILSDDFVLKGKNKRR